MSFFEFVNEEDEKSESYLKNVDETSPLHYVLKFLRDSLLMEIDVFNTLRVLDTSFSFHEYGYIYISIN